MPGGNSLPSNKTGQNSLPSNKTGQNPKEKKSTNTYTVQSLLSARKDLDKTKARTQPKLPKRTHSELSSESDNSMDTSGLNSLQKDLDEIKTNLQGITKKDDLDILTKDLVRTHDLEIIVTSIVTKLFQRFESTMDKKLNTKLVIVQKEIKVMVNRRNSVRISDDVTWRNMQLISKLRDMNCFESVWFYNSGVYGRTEDG
ncbi:unnamed protein product [Mytilus coruscus]|uniref:Uncharacterized protein n=1 Tax=Mytilus coruscus TaxID=42192 RepID=A0A6J8ADQ2_MYTCO|nr:unnamed protein product [Mytilus coruscus]